MDSMKKRFKQKSTEFGWFVKMLRFFKSFFVHVNPIQNCIDIVCFVDKGLQFYSDHRPNTEDAIEQLDKIINKYEEND